MSNATDHLALAREYLAIAESEDSKREAYMKAAEEIAAYQTETDATQAFIAIKIQRSEATVSLLLRWRREGYLGSSPWEADQERRNERSDRSKAKKALSDPEQRRQTLASLPPAEIEAVIEDAHGVAMERLHAKQAEHDTTPRQPTAGDLMGGDRFDPSESWADADIIRVQAKAHALARQVAKWGLVLGSLSEDEAFQMLQEAEQNIAEVRAALQERIADRTGV